MNVSTALMAVLRTVLTLMDPTTVAANVDTDLLPMGAPVKVYMHTVEVLLN